MNQCDIFSQINTIFTHRLVLHSCHTHTQTYIQDLNAVLQALSPRPPKIHFVWPGPPPEKYLCVNRFSDGDVVPDGMRPAYKQTMRHINIHIYLLGRKQADKCPLVRTHKFVEIIPLFSKSLRNITLQIIQWQKKSFKNTDKRSIPTPEINGSTKYLISGRLLNDGLDVSIRQKFCFRSIPTAEILSSLSYLGCQCVCFIVYCFRVVFVYCCFRVVCSMFLTLYLHLSTYHYFSRHAHH